MLFRDKFLPNFNQGSNPNIGMGLPPPQPTQQAPLSQVPGKPKAYNVTPTVQNLLLSNFPRLNNILGGNAGAKQVPMSEFRAAMPGIFPGFSSSKRMK